MLGKAVKARHCPATVSAPAAKSVMGRGQDTSRSFADGEKLWQPLKASPGFVFGKVAGEGASQETGPRRPNPLAFRGERRRP